MRTRPFVFQQEQKHQVCPRNNVLGAGGGRNTEHWVRVYRAATTGFFHTDTPDCPKFALRVNCTDPTPSLPTFSSPTFQLASQHCSKWRLEQRWCKWTWWKVSSKETENIKIFMINMIQTYLNLDIRTCTTTTKNPCFNKCTCRTPK